MAMEGRADYPELFGTEGKTDGMHRKPLGKSASFPQVRNRHCRGLSRAAGLSCADYSSSLARHAVVRGPKQISRIVTGVRQVSREAPAKHQVSAEAKRKPYFAPFAGVNHVLCRVLQLRRRDRTSAENLSAG